MLIFFALAAEVYGQNQPDNIAFEFKQIQKGDNSSDTLLGRAYYFDESLHLHVHHPVNQISYVDGGSMKVYYPYSNRGYHMSSDTPFDLPIVNSLIASLKDDYGLAAIGFKVRSNSTSGDTLITQWEHASGSENGVFEVYHSGNVIVKARFEAQSISLETELDGHKTIDGHAIPTKISTSHQNQRSSTHEKLYFDEISVNPDIPDSVRNFAFPENAEIETRQF
ncbi:hypothetical protein [Natronogracilivirga saccharolytica]|uniref:Uncharacterized protein n=1 Tax=Natronogracilivirga saccharolytica TaxID=2812953 RepID=A0A8J7UUW1_9BACT|nr:hypothetical protein [Natronogracilivirga saccharolytica]MBP3191881.1 hypothetical protein [Natronogracilivirga saccharolytica]